MTPAMSSDSPFLDVPILPFEVDAGLTGREILERMGGISFQGRNLAAAHAAWRAMLRDDVLIFLGTAGALSAGGLRLVLAYMVTHRYIDCVVTTGANLYHDLHETLGRHHYRGHPREDDEALKRDHVDRIYDTYASEDEFCENDTWIADFTARLERRPHTTREYLYKLGEHLWTTTRQDGFLTAAYRARVPIFCPALADSSIGMGISQARHDDPATGQIDVIGDIIESANLVAHHPRTASIVLGGGTPKNFINQASVQAAFYKPDIAGHEYAIQIVTDVPHYGGASGSSLDEAMSWGKVTADATRVTVQADVTLALPLLVSGLVDSVGETSRSPLRQFDLSEPVMVVDGRQLPRGFEVAE